MLEYSGHGIWWGCWRAFGGGGEGGEDKQWIETDLLKRFGAALRHQGEKWIDFYNGKV